jgi:hypothetical protein
MEVMIPLLFTSPQIPFWDDEIDWHEQEWFSRRRGDAEEDKEMIFADPSFDLALTSASQRLCESISYYPAAWILWRVRFGLTGASA